MQNRIPSLDLIRGIALLGILFMNIYLFTLPLQSLTTPDWNHTASLSDKLIYSFQYLFFHGRFYTLFCLLFGAGLVLLAEKWTSNHQHPDRLIKRRLMWLLLFGLMHSWFIWYGDILFSYAAVGLLVLSFYHQDAHKLFRTGVIFYLIGQVLTIALWIALPLLGEEYIEAFTVSHRLTSVEIQEEIDLWNASYVDQVLQNVQFHLFMILMGMSSFWWEIAGFLLIGMGLYKSDVFKNGLSNQYVYTFLLAGLLIGGVDLYYQWRDDFANPMTQYTPFYTLAALFLALFYIHMLVKLSKYDFRLLSAIRNVGRMAFTLYIFQSLSMMIIFRWIYPDHFARYDRIDIVLLAIGFTVVQIVIANIWLRYFRQGPLEALWRWLTLK